MKSASVRIAPANRRCRYWAKVVRAETDLPKPSEIEGANSIPGAYSQLGEEELFPGDILLEGEENHPIKDRGWSFWVTWCDSEGIARRVRNPGREEKAELKANMLPPELLTGSGGLPAVVRLAHGVRLGLFSGGDII